MPRYEVELADVGAAALHEALRLAARRFPELSLEEGLASRRWVCRAPSPTHIHRWAAAAHLDVRSLVSVDIDDSRQLEERGPRT